MSRHRHRYENELSNKTQRIPYDQKLPFINVSSNFGQKFQEDSNGIEIIPNFGMEVPFRKEIRKIRSASKERKKKKEFFSRRSKKIPNFFAKPNLVLTKYPMVLKNVFKFLPMRFLCRCESVCRIWQKAAKFERQNRKFVEVSSLHVGLFKSIIKRRDRESKILSKLHNFSSQFFIQPRYAIAFLTWRSVTELPETLFKSMPPNSATFCSYAKGAVFGNLFPSKDIQYFNDQTRDSVAALFIPKFTNFRIGMLRNFKPTEIVELSRRIKQPIRCVIVMQSQESAEQLNKTRLVAIEETIYEFQRSRCCVVGAPVVFSQWGMRQLFQKDLEATIELVEPCEGIILAGHWLHVRTIMIDETLGKDSLRIANKGFFIHFGINRCFGIIFTAMTDEKNEILVENLNNQLSIPIIGVKTFGRIVGAAFATDRESKKPGMVVETVGAVLVLCGVWQDEETLDERNEFASNRNGYEILQMN